MQPLYFRPPYSIDQEPDTNDQAAPAEHIQNLGYVIVGDKIDTDDWDEHPRKTPQEIIDSVFQQISDMQTRSWMRGSIILLHDGGGDRSATVAALPVLIQALRDRGYTIVPVSAADGQDARRGDAAAQSPTSLAGARGLDRLLRLGLLQPLRDRRLLRRRYPDERAADHHRRSSPSSTACASARTMPAPDYAPRVAVLIPAYNEEKVIVRTIRSVMMSNYKNLRIIVIDDGSTDNTYRAARRCLSGGHRLRPPDRCSPSRTAARPTR